MKKGLLVVLSAVCMVIGSSVFAQKPASQAEQMAKKQVDKLKSELMLNDQQTQQVYQQLVWNMEQKREHSKEVWAKTDVAMKQVLTPDQYAKWSQMQKERVDKAQERIHDKAHSMANGDKAAHNMK